MSFNPEILKQAQEVVFSRKYVKPNHPILHFNQSVVNRTISQKHLGVILDENLNFNQHLKVVIDKTTKGISVLRKLRYYIPRKSLITLYKSFIRSHLDFADVIYDLPNSKTFCDKIESIQYNAALAITGAIRGTSKDKLYKELGLEYLSSRRWVKRLTLFHKFFRIKVLSTFIILFQNLRFLSVCVIKIIYLKYSVEPIFIKIVSFHPVLKNGINSFLKLEQLNL